MQAVQFLRGEVPAEVDGDSIQYSFYQIYNAFLAIYIIFSTENWTDILGTTLASMHHQVWIAAIFLCGWFLFANFILLQMFIAVLNEGFEIVEDVVIKSSRFLVGVVKNACETGWKGIHAKMVKNLEQP